MIRLSKRALTILAIEAGLFLVILFTIWLDEFIDLPRILFHAPPMPYRLEEYLVETGLIGLVAFAVLMITYIGLRRIERLENFLRVCAWCKSVWVDGHWVSFEKYIEAQYRLQATHGICDSCHEKLLHEHAAMNRKQQGR